MTSLRFVAVMCVVTGFTIAASSARAPSVVATTACSPVVIPDSRDPQGTYFVGVPSNDTVQTGVGSVAPNGEGGHWGNGRARDVYGQMVRVDTVAGANADSLYRLFASRGAREVVIVPWDYDPACQPTYWSASARWLEPRLAGFYTVRLRAEAAWADGHPTFDAFKADLQPYPHGIYFQNGFRGTDALRKRPSLDAHEMFSYYSALPTREERREKNAAALRRLEQWREANPELARKYPADQRRS